MPVGDELQQDFGGVRGNLDCEPCAVGPELLGRGGKADRKDDEKTEYWPEEMHAFKIG